MDQSVEDWHWSMDGMPLFRGGIIFTWVLGALLGRCERVLHVMGREVKGRQKCGMQALKRAVAKLQGDTHASFRRKISGRVVTRREISIPVFHEPYYPCISDFQCGGCFHTLLSTLATLHKSEKLRMPELQCLGPYVWRPSERTMTDPTRVQWQGGSQSFHRAIYSLCGPYCFNFSALDNHYNPLCPFHRVLLLCSSCQAWPGVRLAGFAIF